jgi:hypothetical protein
MLGAAKAGESPSAFELPWLWILAWQCTKSLHQCANSPLFESLTAEILPLSIVGVIVGSSKITMVEGRRDRDGTVTLIKDEVFNLEQGDRHVAYVAMHRRIYDRLSHNVSHVVLKASSAGKFTGTQPALLAAELRGVVISAVPASVSVSQEHIKNLSQTGSRKVADYTKDDIWWNEHFAGAVKKAHREAAYLIITVED